MWLIYVIDMFFFVFFFFKQKTAYEMRISDWSSDVCSSDLWLTYDLPEDLVGKLWKGRYRGQRQKWYLARFLGADSDVNLATSHPEFRAWKWASAQELPHMIVPFKRRLYADIVEAFGDWLK